MFLFCVELFRVCLRLVGWWIACKQRHKMSHEAISPKLYLPYFHPSIPSTPWYRRSEGRQAQASIQCTYSETFEIYIPKGILDRRIEQERIHQKLFKNTLILLQLIASFLLCCRRRFRRRPRRPFGFKFSSVFYSDFNRCL